MNLQSESQSLVCCRYTISHRYYANAGQGHFRPLFRYYNTKRLSCQYSGFADGGVRGSFCVCADRRHRFCRACGGGRCTRVRGCAGCMRYMRYRGGVRSDVRDTVEMCGAGTLSHSGGRRCGAGLVQCGLCAGMGCALESTVGVEIRYARAGVCVGEYGGRGNTGRTAAMCFGAAG